MHTIAAFTIALVLMLSLAFAFWPSMDAASTIGGTRVPDTLDCAEDEVIAFYAPDTLDCVHIDVITGREQ